jgi:hypothetical protein
MLHEWVGDPATAEANLDALTRADETAWQVASAPHRLY